MANGWVNYGLLVHISKKLNEGEAGLGKTKFQKLVFMLKELKGINIDYQFHFYTYGPFSKSLAEDISYLNCIDGLNVHFDVTNEKYVIKPGDKADYFEERAAEFIKQNDNDINGILKDFGSKRAAELELLSTMIYVKNYDSNYKGIDYLAFKTSELKPRFSSEEINKGIDELREKGYLAA